MADDITNIVLLQHMQAMKSSLELKIEAIVQKIDVLDQKVDKNTASLTSEMRSGFEEARQHRQALQEDLEATMHMLSKHEKKLARL
jgi:hypothetical protein